MVFVWVKQRLLVWGPCDTRGESQSSNCISSALRMEQNEELVLQI